MGKKHKDLMFDIPTRDITPDTFSFLSFMGEETARRTALMFYIVGEVSVGTDPIEKPEWATENEVAYVIEQLMKDGVIIQTDDGLTLAYIPNWLKKVKVDLNDGNHSMGHIEEAAV